MLFLCTFGGLTLERDGQPVSGVATQRSRLALLAVLAAYQRGVSRDRLLTLFWPESNEERARGALKQSLYTLRRDLDAPDLILGTNDLRLNPGLIDSDVGAFTGALAAGDPASAAAHYKGPFLEGIHLPGAAEFEQWVERERAQLAAAYAGALEQLAVAAEARGDDGGAVRWWQQLAVADPLSAVVASGLLRAFIRVGDRPAALQYARTHEALVRAELDSAPDARFQALVAAIRSGEPLPSDLRSRAVGRTPGDRARETVASSVVPLQREDHESARDAAGRDSETRPAAARSDLAPAVRHRKRSGGVVRLLIIIAAASVVVAALMNWKVPVEPGTTVRFPIDVPAEVPPAAAPLALSPDGRHLAVVVATDSLNRRLYIRSSDDLVLRELPGTHGAEQPFFSPDGKWLGFYQRPLLKKMPVAGGAAIVVGEVREMTGASWGVPDRIVVSTEGALAVISANGGSARVISRPDTTAGEVTQRWPRALADGRTILYTARGSILENSNIAVIDVDGSNKVIFDLRGTGPLGVVDGLLLYATARNLSDRANALAAVPFDVRRRSLSGWPVEVVEEVGVGVFGPAAASVSRSGSLAYLHLEEQRSQLVLAEPGRPPTILLAEPRRYEHPRFSPDGSRIAVVVRELAGLRAGVAEQPTSQQAAQYSLVAHVYVLNVGSGTLTRIDQAANVEWMPDGRHILRGGSVGRDTGLWQQPVDLSSPPKLLVRRGRIRGPESVISPQGDFVVLRSNTPTPARLERDLYYHRLRGDTALRPLVSVPGVDEFGPKISPDGRWVAYYTQGEADNAVYVTSLPGPGPRHIVSQGRGQKPVWSPDGKRLYYFEEGRIIAANLVWRPQFRVVSREIVFERGFRWSNFTWGANFDVAPNGRQFVVVRPLETPPRITFVHGWRHELRARMAAEPPR